MLWSSLDPPKLLQVAWRRRIEDTKTPDQEDSIVATFLRFLLVDCVSTIMTCSSSPTLIPPLSVPGAEPVVAQLASISKGIAFAQDAWPCQAMGIVCDAWEQSRGSCSLRVKRTRLQASMPGLRNVARSSG